MSVSTGFCADEKPPAQTENASAALQKMRQQCDNPQDSQDLAWPSSVSITEMMRSQAIEELRAEQDGLGVVRRELDTATGEYRQMLVIASAALGDKDAAMPAAQLMLSAEKPAVRVVAAFELSRLKRLVRNYSGRKKKPVLS